MKNGTWALGVPGVKQEFIKDAHTLLGHYRAVDSMEGSRGLGNWKFSLVKLD